MQLTATYNAICVYYVTSMLGNSLFRVLLGRNLFGEASLTGNHSWRPTYVHGSRYVEYNAFLNEMKRFVHFRWNH
jgi:hypothetical protein